MNGSWLVTAASVDLALPDNDRLARSHGEGDLGKITGFSRVVSSRPSPTLTIVLDKIAVRGVL
jgi:hypothetical protein